MPLLVGALPVGLTVLIQRLGSITLIRLLLRHLLDDEAEPSSSWTGPPKRKFLADACQSVPARRSPGS
jgi:hypothetical protein